MILIILALKKIYKSFGDVQVLNRVGLSLESGADAGDRGKGTRQ